jgi:hypothetical protein
MNKDKVKRICTDCSKKGKKESGKIELLRKVFPRKAGKKVK